MRVTVGMFFYSLTIYCSLFLLTNQAWAQNEAAQCDSVIPVSVPAFSCSDGLVVPKVVDRMGHCEKPEDLYTTCRKYSTLGKLAENNKKDVQIRFSCRRAKLDDATSPFHDIAVIQHNEKTGATCFYQYLGSHSGENLPAPNSAAGKNFWNQPVDYCSSCHTNGPFIRSPDYWQVVDAHSDHILPSVYSIKKYTLANTTPYQVYDVYKKGNACVSCHNVGAYKTSEGSQLQIGRVNKLAAGQVHSLSGGNSPTVSGYDDFMADYAGGRENAVKALEDLEGCLGSTSTDCGVVSTERSSVCANEPLGTQCYWMENSSGNYCWVKSPSGVGDINSCKALDSCNGGGGASGGGCYKWAECPNCNRFPW
ncbi:hypothetical protein AB833_20985 [Chromatiales bacterium (ex Bugula neritina AB1)]|nr:hypothetical protein AB833_20985 [Chromatiales bacterium (ex Bugula neritina AB1)]